MVDNFSQFLDTLRWTNFKILSNHGGQFEYIFNYLRWVNSKNFSNHGGEFDDILVTWVMEVLNIMLEVSKFQQCLQPSVHPVCLCATYGFQDTQYFIVLYTSDFMLWKFHVSSRYWKLEFIYEFNMDSWKNIYFSYEKSWKIIGI